jgi:hemolysin activation/secretion protein
VIARLSDVAADRAACQLPLARADAANTRRLAKIRLLPRDATCSTVGARIRPMFFPFTALPLVTRALLLCLMCWALALPARAADPVPKLSYRVERLAIEYALPHPEQPPVSELLALEVEFTPVRGGYREPIPRNRIVKLRLDQIPRGARFFTSALVHIQRALLAEFERRGIGGIIVTAPDLEEGSGRDLRSVGATELRLRIWTARVARVTSFADGERYAGQSVSERTDHPAHARIRAGAPVQSEPGRDLLRAREIEDYALRLSRHPGRRVDAELSPGPETSSTDLTLRVAEVKPWWTYGEISNTGTQATTRLRERVGLTHTQLTGRDDILRFDYVTGNFDEVHALFASYELPTPGFERLRWRALGSYSRYDASELGFSESEFSGRQWETGLGARLGVFQYRETFLDLDAQFRWQHASVSSDLTGSNGNADFALARAGWRIEREDLISALDLEGHLEFNIPELTGSGGNRRAIGSLGRPNADAGFSVWRWSGSLSLFLEPVLNRSGFYDPATPLQHTLAHELWIAFRAQYSHRVLPPQHEEVVGGFYTLRGYDESLIAGDRGASGTLEYRFHLPRALRPSPKPWRLPLVGDVRAVPAHALASPDWDLVLRAFADAAWSQAIDSPSVSKPDATLASVGAGLELQFLRHLNARLDVGVPLLEEKALAKAPDKYDPRLHFSLTLLY